MEVYEGVANDQKLEWAMSCLSSALACLDALADHKCDPEFVFWFEEMRTASAQHLAKGTSVSVPQWKELFARMMEKHTPPCARCGRSGHLAKVCHCYNHATQTIEGSSTKRFLIEERFLNVHKKPKFGRPDYDARPTRGLPYGDEQYMGPVMGEEEFMHGEQVHFHQPPPMWQGMPPPHGAPPRGRPPPYQPARVRGTR